MVVQGKEVHHPIGQVAVAVLVVLVELLAVDLQQVLIQLGLVLQLLE